ncbi:MAG: hypothetical protein ACRC26_01370 [Bacteroidales bacterium]
MELNEQKKSHRSDQIICVVDWFLVGFGTRAGTRPAPTMLVMMYFVGQINRKYGVDNDIFGWLNQPCIHRWL